MGSRFGGLSVGVVIPTYNAAAGLVAAIPSVLEQGPPPQQIVVVDDGSTDDTASRLREWGSRVEYVYQSNAGPSAARNVGWSKLRTDLVVFLDADDLLLPDALEVRRELFADLTTMWAYTEGLLEDPNGNRWPFSMTYPAGETAGPGRVFRDLLCKNFITASALTVRRDALQAVGGFDEAIRGTEDWDLSLRLAARYPVRNCPTPTFVQRLGENTLSCNRPLMDRMRYATLVKIYALFPNKVLASGLKARRSVADAHNAMAYSLARQRRWHEARPCLWRSVRLWPWQGRAWLFLVCSLLSRSR